MADNGIGCNAAEIRQKMEESGDECFALRNVKERIMMEYGTDGKFLFFSRPGHGTLVKLFLKLKI